MTKRDEIYDSNSCLSKAALDEPLFVLRGSDPVAPNTIRHWAKLAKAWKAHDDDRQKDALKWADEMEAWWRSKHRQDEAGEQQGDGDTSPDADAKDDGEKPEAASLQFEVLEQFVTLRDLEGGQRFRFGPKAAAVYTALDHYKIVGTNKQRLAVDDCSCTAIYWDVSKRVYPVDGAEPPSVCLKYIEDKGLFEYSGLNTFLHGVYRKDEGVVAHRLDNGVAVKFDATTFVTPLEQVGPLQLRRKS